MAKQSDDLETLARELMGHFDVLKREYLDPQRATLTSTETTLLAVLAEHGPATMSEISAHVGLALSSTTGLVDRLVERRLVERARAESDRRTVRVMLTTRGKRAFESFRCARIGLGRGLLERLQPRERQVLLGLFRKVTAKR